MRQHKITIDFETRSRVNLKTHGTWVYAIDPSTEVMCISWRCGDEKGFWHMGHTDQIKKLKTKIERAKNLRDRAKQQARRDNYQDQIDQMRDDIEDLRESPVPTRLFELIAEGTLVEAHNAFFERCIWQHICVERMGWLEIGEDQWRCSAAKAAMHAIPRSLEEATKEMCPHEEKDLEGRQVMLKLCKPAKPTKAEPDRKWHEEASDLRILWAYCEQDTKSEEALSESLIDLPDRELQLWQMDQRMNLRGFYCDHDLAHKAIALAKETQANLNGDLATATHGSIEKATQRTAIRAWLKGKLGFDPGGTGAPVLEALMLGDLSAEVREVMQIVLGANKTSVKKYQAMLDRSDPVDHRIRDMMMYHGAGTGRWAGKGVQPHNFPRGFSKDMEADCAMVLVSNLRDLLLLMEYSASEVMELLSWILRGALCAPDGRILYVADYAAIEARVLVWLANDQAALQVFRDGKDIYKDMATAIYNIPYSEVESEHRRMGKQAILGLGYQMGAPKFWDTIAGYEPEYKGVGMNKDWVEFTCKPGDVILKALHTAAKRVGDETLEDRLKYGWTINDDNKAFLLRSIPDQDMREQAYRFMFVRDVVIKYRTKYDTVKTMWSDQNKAAIAAVEDRGSRQTANNVTWWCDNNDFLRCTLPSGRDLFYRKPHIKKNKFGNPALNYWSVDAVTKKFWETSTYGGKLVENITQAVARDLMADAMLLLDKHPTYDLLASVHDELICEADQGSGDVKEFENLMATVPAWAQGCPVKAEGWSGMRYRK